MNQDFSNIDQLFKDGLNSHNVQVSPEDLQNAWDKVQNLTPQVNPSNGATSGQGIAQQIIKSIAKIGWMGKAAIVVVISSAIITGVVLLNSKDLLKSDTNTSKKEISRRKDAETDLLSNNRSQSIESNPNDTYLTEVKESNCPGGIIVSSSQSQNTNNGSNSNNQGLNIFQPYLNSSNNLLTGNGQKSGINTSNTNGVMSTNYTYQTENITICISNPYKLSSYEGISKVDFGDGTIISPNQDNQILNHYYTKPGVYTSTVISSQNETATTIINVLSSPKADFTLSCQANLSVKLALFSEPNVNYSANFGDNKRFESLNGSNQIRHTYQDTGRYKVMLIASTSNLGCTDTQIKWIIIEDKNIISSIPNIFTPNKDGLNDDWGIPVEKVQEVENFELSIFDGQNQLVFKTKNPLEKWNGLQFNNGKDLPFGSYYYVAVIKFKTCDEPTIKKGIIQLSR